MNIFRQFCRFLLKKYEFPTKIDIEICRKVVIKTEFPTNSLSFQHIEISIQQLLRPNISIRPLAAYDVSILQSVH